MENGGRRSSHGVVFAYPKHDHMSPMLQFAKRLASKGLRVTFLTTSSATQSLQINLPPSIQIVLQFISDIRTEAILSLNDEHKSFEVAVSRLFGDFIDRALRNSDCDPPPLKFFIVFDSVMPWAMDVATERGLDLAPFFTESCAVNHILNQVYEGSLCLSSVPPAAAISIPPLPVLEEEDLPFFPHELEVVMKFMTRQFSSFKNAKWVFVNTFHQLEMKDRLTMRMIGKVDVWQGLYLLQTNSSQLSDRFTETVSICSSLSHWKDAHIWHDRMGHPSH